MTGNFDGVSRTKYCCGFGNFEIQPSKSKVGGRKACACCVVAGWIDENIESVLEDLKSRHKYRKLMDSIDSSIKLVRAAGRFNEWAVA